MHQRLFFILILVGSNLELLCQTTTTSTRPKPAPDLNNTDRFANQVTIRDVYGQPFKNNYADIKGSPFFIDDWLYSSVKLVNDVRCDRIQARLDLVRQELHFTSIDKEDWVFYAQFLKEVEFSDSSSGKNYKFITGLPSIDNQNENNFYLVLSEGQVSLLKSIRKTISVNKDDISGEVEKKFDVYEDYYIFSGKEIKRLKREKEFILKALADKKDSIESYLKKNPANFKNVNDIIKLFQFYNSPGH
jgi:hypothetical protein